MSSDTRVYDQVVAVDAARAVKDIQYAQRIATHEPAFIVYHESFLRVLGSSPQIKLIETRDYQFAHEAGVYIPSTDSVSMQQICDKRLSDYPRCTLLPITKPLIQ